MVNLYIWYRLFLYLES